MTVLTSTTTWRLDPTPCCSVSLTTMLQLASRNGARPQLPAEVITPATVEEVFGLECDVIADPLTGTPLVLPVPAHRRGS
jgi:ABC-type cobalamin/Fe3+-siderophores transport system ATPase subunit